MRSKPDAILFDMDGTLTNVNAIRHHVQFGNTNFTKFHEESVDCPPNQWVVDAAVEGKLAGFEIVVVTARRAEFRHHTAMWLALNGVPSDAMFMRHDRDQRGDVFVKRDILNRIRLSWNPVHAFDDNPKVVALWREEGIPVTVVPGWSG